MTFNNTYISNQSICYKTFLMKRMGLIMPTLNRIPSGGRNAWTPFYNLSKSKKGITYWSTGNIFLGVDLSRINSIYDPVEASNKCISEHHCYSSSSKLYDGSISKVKTEAPHGILTSPETKAEDGDFLNYPKFFARNGELMTNQALSKSTDMWHSSSASRANKHILVLKLGNSHYC